VRFFLREMARATAASLAEKNEIDPRDQARAEEMLFLNWHRDLMERFHQDPQEAAIETMILANKARELDVVISDHEITEHLKRITENRVTGAMLSNVIGSLKVQNRRISQARVFEALRTEMLASRLTTMYSMGLRIGPPAERWDYFRRLNEKATVEVLPIAASTFVSKIDDPPPQVVEEFFNKYRDRLAVPGSPEPGFKQPHRAAFQYFKADRQHFLAQVKVTDKEIQDYYEANKEDFRTSSLPEDDTKKPAADHPDGATEPKPPAGGTEPTIPPAGAEPSAPKGGSDPTAPPSGTEPAVPPTGGTEPTLPPDAKPNSSAPDESPNKPEKKPAENDGEAATASPPPGTGPVSKGPFSPPQRPQEPPGNGGGAQNDPPKSIHGRIRFLLASSSDEKKPAASGDVAPDNGKPPAANSQAEKPDKATDSKDTGTNDPAVKDPAAKDADTKDTAAKDPIAKDPAAKDATVAKDKNSGATPADSKAADTKGSAEPKLPTAGEPAAGTAAAKPGDASPPKYEPLEKVRESIRNFIASEKVRAEMENRLAKLNAEMRRYASERVLYGARKDSDPTLQPPRELDFEALAKANGLGVMKTESVSAFEVKRYDIGNSYKSIEDRRMPTGERRIPFTEIAYNENLPLFRPADITFDDEGNHYLFWKVADAPEEVPTLEQARPQVIRAWKLIQARKLALKEAERLAAEARKSGKPLAESSPEKGKVQKVGPFTWMTTGNVPFDPIASRPRISEIEGVPNAGRDFMREVFRMSPGETGAAMDAPQETAYVIRLEKLDPSREDLENEFAVVDARKYMAAAEADRREMYLRWLEGLEREAGLKWHRTPTQLASN